MLLPTKESIFPYVVPKSWVDSVPEGSLLSWEISDDVYIVLVFDGSGVVKNVRPEDLEHLGVDETSVFELCVNNLGRAWHEQQFEFGCGTLADGTKLAVSEGSFMAPAGALLLRNFYESLSADFGRAEFIAIAVNQECLLAFPDDEKTLASTHLRKVVDERFHGHRKPVSRSWLLLNGEWPRVYPRAQRF